MASPVATFSFHLFVAEKDAHSDPAFSLDSAGSIMELVGDSKVTVNDGKDKALNCSRLVTATHMMMMMIIIKMATNMRNIEDTNISYNSNSRSKFVFCSLVPSEEQLSQANRCYWQRT